LSVYWAAFRAQSIGSVAVDTAFSAAGKFNQGIDFTGTNFGTNLCAIALKRGDRIYGNAATTDPNVLKPTSLGTDYFANSANGWDFTVGGVIAFRAGANGNGYVTGAGGAVTQTTSRTTAPPAINKPCGQITLVSAAGTATWQTFTVSNSTVAATDVICLDQASGTDKYMIHVTHVGAGTFDVTFATTGGTTTEQPVFNFAVLKAVAA
jgi:hypothetical protein